MARFLQAAVAVAAVWLAVFPGRGDCGGGTDLESVHTKEWDFLKKFGVEPESPSEEGGYVFPKRLRCDACKATAFQMYKFLHHATKKNTQDVGEAAMFDVLDQTCRMETFGGYAITGFKENILLSGPGMVGELLVDRLGKRVGNVPIRLTRMCQEISAEHETLVYSIFRSYQYAENNPRRLPEGKFTTEVCKEFHYCKGTEEIQRYAMDVPDDMVAQERARRQEEGEPRRKRAKRRRRKRKKKKKKKRAARL